MKERKENNIPSALINNEEPSRKRSKLVLPEPQITDTEMEQIVKLGKASEAARESVTDSAEGGSMRASGSRQISSEALGPFLGLDRAKIIVI